MMWSRLQVGQMVLFVYGFVRGVEDDSVDSASKQYLVFSGVVFSLQCRWKGREMSDVFLRNAL